MKVYQVRGYPRNHYFVKTFSELLEIMSWSEKTTQTACMNPAPFMVTGSALEKTLNGLL